MRDVAIVWYESCFVNDIVQILFFIIMKCKDIVR